MPRSPARFAKSAGRAVGGPAGRLFSVTGVLFNSEEIESLLDKKSRVTFERLGRRMMRDARRSLKPGRRYSKISDIPTKDPYYKALRRRLRIQERLYLRNKIPNPPVMPWIPSKPGGIPKARGGNNSLLKKGILFSYEPGLRNVVVGAAPIGGKVGKAPSVLEHGEGLEGSKVAQRPFMSKTMERMRNNGKLKKILEKGFKV